MVSYLTDNAITGLVQNLNMIQNMPKIYFFCTNCIPSCFSWKVTLISWNCAQKLESLCQYNNSCHFQAFCPKFGLHVTEKTIQIWFWTSSCRFTDLDFVSKHQQTIENVIEVEFSIFLTWFRGCETFCNVSFFNSKLGARGQKSFVLLYLS